MGFLYIIFILMRYSAEIIKKEDPIYYEKIMNWNCRPQTNKFCERVYMYDHKLTNPPCCPICGKPVKWRRGYMRGYNKSCGDKICKKKIKENTYLTKYGVKNPLLSESSREKAKQTNLERYGVDNPFSSKEIQGKIKQTNIERYGVGHPMKSDYIRHKNSDTQKHGYIKKNEDLIGYTKTGDWICKCPHPDTCDRCSEKYFIIEKRNNQSPSTFLIGRLRLNTELCTRLLPIQPIFSSYELQVRSWLDNLHMEYTSNDRTIISPQELDIYIPEKQLAIEINGCYWHSVECKSKSYHMNKWSQCREKEIKMITLWEDWIQDHPNECKQLIMYHLGMIDAINIPWDHNLVDLGLGSGSVKEHLSIHDGYK